MAILILYTNFFGRGQYYRLSCLYELLPRFEIKLQVVDFFIAGHIFTYNASITTTNKHIMTFSGFREHLFFELIWPESFRCRTWGTYA